MNINARVQVLDWTLDSKPSIALTHVADGETESQRLTYAMELRMTRSAQQV